MQLPTLQVSSQAVQQRQRGVGGRGLRCQARCFRAGGSRSLQGITKKVAGAMYASSLWLAVLFPGLLPCMPLVRLPSR